MSGTQPGDVRDIDVVAPNFKRRLSGVTSTIVQLVPCQRRLGVRIATLGPGLPKSLPALRWRDLVWLWTPPAGRSLRIWHARRNNEMAAGILLRDVLRMPLKLVFTSAAQRRHTAYTRFLIRRMDAVIATSGRSGSFLEVPHSVVRHGVDLDLFRPPAGEADTAAAAGFRGRHLVGCFGRVRHQKGTDLFVRAMIELLPDHPQWTAIVCGRVTAEHQRFADGLKQEVLNAGLADRILFLGEVDDIKPWYRRLTLYVAPSRNEGFGLTPLEAMASQTAVVASDAGAYAEMIVPGLTGAVVPAGDGEALKAALASYLADPHLAEQAGRAALLHVGATFALEREARAVNAIYANLADPGNGQA
ncbi:glycosyltransferase family 4 protein [Rhizobium sp. TRM95111]|uniref:glycosyltransferase family 4 protein n=1 Tax=Rhizobium alarense TaxID=2846851 RepID=UPI001F2731C0|nr:glycosyltransferase family 4 protein [Rhizobium alarense]MCF3642348.1 glycosyltransferase family 4 protein [Rhizobium alarense]